MTKKNKLLGNILLLIAAIIWGTAFAFQRVGMDSIEPITFAASRMTLSAVVVGAFSLFFKTPNEFTEEEKRKYNKNTVLGGICCGVFLAIASIAQQMGIVYTSAGKAGFITALYMLFVPVINFFIFRKRNTILVWGAVALGVFGMYLLCMNESFSLAYGDTLVLICAILFSGHILCCDYFVNLGNPIKISAIQFVTTAIISWIAAFLTEVPSVDKIVSAAIPILYCGIMSGGMGYTLQIVAQKHTEPATASLLMSLESVFAVIAGALILNEQMLARELIGCAVMFAAIIIVQIPSKSSAISND